MDIYEKIKQLRNEDHQFLSLLGIEITEVQEGYAKGEIKIEERHGNLIGSVHGGCIFSLADTVCGAAVSTYGNKMTTISADFHFLSPAIGVTKLIAVSKVIKRGKTLTVCDVEVFDEKEKLIAKGTFPFFNLGVPLEGR